MREILFRGKTPEDALGFYELDWAFGNLVIEQETGKTFIVDLGKFNSNTKFGSIAVEVNPETVGQYTGLQDKNGKKIFEGDIVKCYYDDIIYNDYSIDHFGIGRRVIETTKICVCEIDKLNPCFVLRNIEKEYDVEYDFVKCDLLELEVIGNICDNPELLEGEK